MFNFIVTLQALSQSIHSRGRELCSYIIIINTRSGDDLCEFFLFIISIANCYVQHHSNYTGSIAIYSRGVSRERSRVTPTCGGLNLSY